jgi:hypothetical protein
VPSRRSGKRSAGEGGRLYRILFVEMDPGLYDEFESTIRDFNERIGRRREVYRGDLKEHTEMAFRQYITRHKSRKPRGRRGAGTVGSDD